MYEIEGYSKTRAWRFDNPYQVLALSFLSVMFLGTILLMLPISSSTGNMTSVVDAAFTAVSCVSVTGLATLDTYHYWSLFGKTIMVILIQLGGLGIMTFTTLVALIFGQRIGLKSRLLLLEDIGSDGLHGLLNIVKHIAFLTFSVEFVGGFIYAIQLYPYIGQEAFYIGFFQAISIFCNAGFVFFDNDLPYKMVSDWIFTFNTTSLIIIGGFGYISIFDIIKNLRTKRSFQSLSLHTRIMFFGTITLIIGGTIFILGLEWSNPETLGNLSILNKIQAAYLQSVTPRTAGIATLDYGQMHPVTIFLTIILMFIGAGPNSTGGGIKITTMVVAFLAACSIFNNKGEVEIFYRKIPTATVFKSFGIILFSIILILLATFVLAWMEDIEFLRLLFEVTSAFGTVGLSTGITPDLNYISKWTLIIVMFTGRVGVLTFVGSLALKEKKQKLIHYPESDILM